MAKLLSLHASMAYVLAHLHLRLCCVVQRQFSVQQHSQLSMMVHIHLLVWQLIHHGHLHVKMQHRVCIVRLHLLGAV